MTQQSMAITRDRASGHKRTALLESLFSNEAFHACMHRGSRRIWRDTPLHLDDTDRVELHVLSQDAVHGHSSLTSSWLAPWITRALKAWGLIEGKSRRSFNAL